jgi:hypothetical protein
VGSVNEEKALMGAMGGGMIAYFWWSNLFGCDTPVYLEVVSSRSPNNFTCLNWIDIDSTWEVVFSRGSYP